MPRNQCLIWETQAKQYVIASFLRIFIPFLVSSDALFSEQIAKLGWRQGKARRWWEEKKVCHLPTVASVLSWIGLSIDSFSKVFLNTYSAPRSGLGLGTTKVKKIQVFPLKSHSLLRESQTQQVIEMLCNKLYIRRNSRCQGSERIVWVWSIL